MFPRLYDWSRPPAQLPALDLVELWRYIACMARALAFRETEKKTGSATGTRERKIRCPKCSWQPGKHDRWSCACGHTWNTFDTRGICPACDAPWRDTQCLRCHEWSRHDDWYADEHDPSPTG